MLKYNFNKEDRRAIRDLIQILLCAMFGKDESCYSFYPALRHLIEKTVCWKPSLVNLSKLAINGKVIYFHLYHSLSLVDPLSTIILENGREWNMSDFAVAIVDNELRGALFFLDENLRTIVYMPKIIPRIKNGLDDNIELIVEPIK